MGPVRRFLAVTIVALAVAAAAFSAPRSPDGLDQWPTYGGDPGGTRYSPLGQITRANVSRLARAWSYQTGERGHDARDGAKLTFEATPILVDGRLYLSTAFGMVIALDPTTGRELWTFDPRVDRQRRFSEVTSRGVSAWRDPRAAVGAPCGLRLFAGTIDARLFALDGATGRPCAGFGGQGVVDLTQGVKVESPSDYQVTSPPAVARETVVVGSSIGDNWHADTGSGVVRGFDARTGALRWAWHPLAPGGRAGAANTWSVISADPERDLVFLPTTSPSPDFFGGLRPGDNAHANSVVALRASSGERVWSFQTVHHDLWDYDLAAQPVLVTVRRDGRDLPAVAVPTKMGSLFLLERETGRPVFPVEERPVPRSDVLGETSWPTQPFPVRPRPLMPLAPLTADTAWGPTEADRAECQALVRGYRSEGIYTPPSLRGTIMSPGNGSGTNWGSAAFDRERRLLVLNTARLMTLVQLLPREGFDAARAASEAAGEDWEYGRQREAPYGMRRRTLLSSKGLPCHAPPWGTLAAVALDTGEVRWEVPLGGVPDGHPLKPALGDGAIGLPNGGGPVVTAGGLVFIGAAFDQRLRAFDVETGRELWSAPLPYAGIATPMTYLGADGRQYVVIAAGGHGKSNLAIGDEVVAFALPAR
jgi:quinoprotein glucose dehydrogenase